MTHTLLVPFNQKDTETAAKLLYAIMQDCVAAEVFTTTANIYRTVDRLVDINCEQQFG
jgi:hypothetical protein